jgi:arginyl-tRNA synthetase
MDIYKMLKDGVDVETLAEMFEDAVEEAQARLEQEKKEEAERKERAEYASKRRKETREALGNALIEFAIAHDLTEHWTERNYCAIEQIIDQMPRVIKNITENIPYAWRFSF